MLKIAWAAEERREQAAVLALAWQVALWVVMVAQTIDAKCMVVEAMFTKVALRKAGDYLIKLLIHELVHNLSAEFAYTSPMAVAASSARHYSASANSQNHKDCGNAASQGA